MSELNQNVLNEFISYLKTKHKNILQELKLEYCTDDNEYIYLVQIKIYKSKQRKGYGSAILNEVCQLANKHNVRIKLYATDIFGSDLKRLYGFYRKHKFVLIKNGENEMLYKPKKRLRKL